MKPKYHITRIAILDEGEKKRTSTVSDTLVEDVDAYRASLKRRFPNAKSITLTYEEMEER